MENILTLNNIHFSYRNTKALDGVDLKIGSGIYGLLGPNGAGKTTLMKIILGFLAPSHGSGSVLNCSILNEHIEIRRKIGYMPETDCLIPGMDGVSLTAYLGELSGMPKGEAMKRAHEVLYYVGLEEARYRKAETYSSGMKQRLKLASAIVHDPELLFLDEPTSGMDPNSRREILELIRDIAQHKKMNIIISSHILSDIEYTCQSALIMNQGKIVSTHNITELNSAKLNGMGITMDQSAAKPKEKVYEIRVKGDLDKLIADLPGVTIRKGKNNKKQLVIPADMKPIELFGSSLKTGVQIRHLVQQKTTLEDTFVSAMGVEDAN